MPQGKPEDICGDYGGRRQDGEPCGRAAGWGREGADTGKCRQCYGKSEDGSSHENNGFAEKHGLRSDTEKWWERHKDEYAEDVVDAVAGWMEDAPFGWDNTGNVKLLVQAAKNECQIDHGDAYIDENGVIITETKTVTEDGREIKEEKENPAFKPKSRLQRDTVRILEKLGILDSPDAEQADATGDLASAIESLKD